MVDDFSVEIAAHLGGITQILNNLQRLIDDLPDKRDNSDIIVNVETLKERVEFIKESITTTFNNHDIILTKLDTIVSNIPDMSVVNQLLDKFKTCNLGQIEKICKCIDDELINLKIKWENDPVKIKVEDIKEIIVLSKRLNKRYDFWNGWKIYAVWTCGIIFTILMYYDKIIKILKLFGLMDVGGN